jgi:serine/threonine-protein kinase
MSDGPATATKSAAPDPLIGRVIAERFKVTDLIARGGMGKVYRAEQAPLGRLCAVKVLNPNYNGDADPEFHRRFFREASVTSKITHPNSVTIFDYGTDGDIYYMAMEYLEGQTLHHALREEKTIAEDRAGRIAQQICRALREAHALGVIHRDLKPANIMLTRHGDDEDFVKVLDFGLVKHISERPEEQLTQTGLFMGSPKYMAPEQIQGAVVDARTDIYSLGIIMYEMLAGKVPFERATSVNILMAHVGEPPPPMREVNPNLICTPAFEELVMRCIAKEPDQRFRSMDELLQAIKRVHGVSMTGQLAAVMASGSYVPPPVRSSTPGAGAAGVVVASGPYTPSPMGMGILRADATDTPPPILDTLAPPPRRSRAWIALGVVFAAALGGLLGMAAFRLTSPAPAPRATAAGAPAATGAAGAANAAGTASAGGATPSAQSAAGAAVLAPDDARVATLHVTSEPTGATVREGDVELCAATPCEVAFRGDAAGVPHRLLVQKSGFRAESKTVTDRDATVAVKLTRVGSGSHARPQPTAARTSSSTQPTAPTATSVSNPPPAASGYKDTPY